MPTLQLHQRRMHYLDQGKGFPLLLGHSYLFNAAMWAPQIEALSQNYRLIVPDLWGHGDSEALPDGHRELDDLADDYLALMDALNISEFAVIGLSVGGMWGAVLAAKAPERVKALVLMDTFVGLEPEVSHQKYFAIMDAIEASGQVPPAMAQQVAAMFFRRDFPDEAMIRVLTERLMAMPKETLLNTIVPLGRMIFGRADGCPQLETLKMPALVITGEQDQPRPPLEGHLMAEILGCRQEVIAGAGHISTLEQPERVNQVLAEFLASVL